MTEQQHSSAARCDTPYLVIDVLTADGAGKVLLTWRTVRTATHVYVDVYAAYCAPADVERFDPEIGIRYALDRIGQPGCVRTIRTSRAAGPATAAAVRAHVEMQALHIAARMRHCPDWAQKPLTNEAYRQKALRYCLLYGASDETLRRYMQERLLYGASREQVKSLLSK